jgi:hypothetical protein
MSPNLDEKKQVIVLILDRLRPHQRGLGSYIKSIYTIEFDYSVKLSNGLIRIPEELVQDYETNPSAITEIRFQRAAARFVPDIPEPTPVPSSNPAVTTPAVPVTNQKSSSGGYWRVIVILLLILAGYYYYRSVQSSQARDNIYKQVTTEGSTYMVNKLFGGIKGLKITATNNSDYLVDIVRVKVTYLKADGDVYKTEMLYYNHVKPYSTQTLDAPDSDRGTKVQITQESFTCAALDIR